MYVRQSHYNFSTIQVLHHIARGDVIISVLIVQGRIGTYC